VCLLPIYECPSPPRRFTPSRGNMAPAWRPTYQPADWGSRIGERSWPAKTRWRDLREILPDLLRHPPRPLRSIPHMLRGVEQLAHAGWLDVLHHLGIPRQQAS